MLNSYKRTRTNKQMQKLANERKEAAKAKKSQEELESVKEPKVKESNSSGEPNHSNHFQSDSDVSTTDVDSSDSDSDYEEILVKNFKSKSKNFKESTPQQLEVVESEAVELKPEVKVKAQPPEVKASEKKKLKSRRPRKVIKKYYQLRPKKRDPPPSPTASRTPKNEAPRSHSEVLHSPPQFNYISVNHTPVGSKPTLNRMQSRILNW